MERELALRMKTVGSLVPGLQEGEKAVKIFTGQSLSSLSKVSLGFIAVGAAAAAAVGAMVQTAYEFDKSLHDLRNETGMTAAQMFKFKDSILTAGSAAGVSGDSMAALSTSWVKQTGDLANLNTHLGQIAQMYSVVGGDASEFGKMTGKVFEESGMAWDDFYKQYSEVISFSRQPGRKSSLEDILPNAGTMAQKLRFAYGSDKSLGDVLSAELFTTNPERLNRAISTFTKYTTAQLNASLGSNLTSESGIAEAYEAIIKKYPGGTKNEMLEKFFGLGASEVEEFAAAMNHVLELKNQMKDIIPSQAEKNAATIEGKITAIKNAWTEISTVSINNFLKDMGLLNEKFGEIDVEKLKAIEKTVEILIRAATFSPLPKIFVAARWWGSHVTGPVLGAGVQYGEAQIDDVKHGVYTAETLTYNALHPKQTDNAQLNELFEEKYNITNQNSHGSAPTFNHTTIVNIEESKKKHIVEEQFSVIGGKKLEKIPQGFL